MPEQKSIKLQIMELLVALHTPLIAQGYFRVVERSMDLFLTAAVRPALHIFDSPEKLMAKDNRGRTYRFDVGLKILIEDPKELAHAKDLLVPKVQAVMENNLQLENLATIVDGGDEIPFLSESNKPLGGALVGYTIEYRRLLGNPYATY